MLMNDKMIKNRINRLSIRQKLVWSVALVTIIPILILFSFIMFWFIHTNIKSTQEQAQLAINKATDELQLWYTQATEWTSSLAVDLNVQHEINNYLLGSYQRKQEARDYLHNRLMSIYTSDMRILNASIYVAEIQKSFSGDFFDENLYDVYHGETWFQEILSGERTNYTGYGSPLSTHIFLSDHNAQLIPHQAVIIASSIVSLNTGEIIGIAYIELDMENVYDIFQNLVEDSTNAVVVNGQFIHTSESPPSNYISVNTFVPGLELSVEYRLNMHDFYISCTIALALFAVGLFALLILLYSIIRLFTNWFAQRIEHLSNATLEIAKGNLAVQISDHYNDEIGELATNLNQMTHDMKRLIERNYLAKIDNQKMMLHTLQNQINPHFIYNTLGSVSMLALAHDNYEIADIVQAFSAMMRYSMDERMLVSVEEEFDNIRNYEKIQDIRFPGKFHMIYQISPDCEEEPLPRLTLQPLIENAFKHGCETMIGTMNLIVSIKKKGKYLLIRVYNDGSPIPRERIREIRNYLNLEKPASKDCFALCNINRRLKLTYGEEARLSISTGASGKTITKIKIPLYFNSDREESKGKES